MVEKFISRGFRGRATEADRAHKERIPPCQYETKDFPVLSALYGHGMGAIRRCAGCDTVLIRITHIRGNYRLDLRGMGCLLIGQRLQ
jgi:hypothetical protein